MKSLPFSSLYCGERGNKEISWGTSRDRSALPGLWSADIAKLLQVLLSEWSPLGMSVCAKNWVCSLNVYNWRKLRRVVSAESRGKFAVVLSAYDYLRTF